MGLSKNAGPRSLRCRNTGKKFFYSRQKTSCHRHKIGVHFVSQMKRAMLLMDPGLFRSEALICRGAIIDFPLSYCLKSPSGIQDSANFLRKSVRAQPFRSNHSLSRLSLLEPLPRPPAYSTGLGCPRRDRWFPPFRFEGGGRREGSQLRTKLFLFGGGAKPVPFHRKPGFTSEDSKD